MTSPSGRLLRADLHIHTRHSRLDALPVLGARDCYTDPRQAYLRAKARGMDLVTFTDHDTIDGCLELLSREGELPDFFISEEASALEPSTGIRLHLSVYGIDEETHREIQRLRGDVRELLSYLGMRGIPAALNHIGSSLVRGRMSATALLRLAEEFPLVETRNGAQGEASNRLAGGLAALLERSGRRVGRTGGSDAHTLRRIGWSWTEARAEGTSSFLQALRERRVLPAGGAAGLGPVLRDVYQIVLRYYADVAANRNGHFSARQRWKAAGCALLSLPLHVVALPALGTILRRIRVRGASSRYGRELEGISPACLADGTLDAGSPGSIRAAKTTAPVLPSVAWVPRPGSEEA